ncbi:MAG: sigma-70 family RNA polymerase sigma factor [Actinobacteria bacterium]|nr:sigma-70 family RNA polymerase sigma factor [Actinomycetota bacterium]MCB9413012.1 sigma-70 family RNA polymerase sigma factor [Actinomycetota bacterium]
MTASAQGPAPGELLERTAEGDEAAFAQFYQLMGPVAYGLALRITRDTHMAQDVLQETFAAIWSQAGRYDPETSSARAWVAMMAHRRAVDRVRREQSERDRGASWASGSETTAHDSVAEVVQLRAEHRRVRAALERLTPLQREALDLAYFAGHTHTEVAQRLDIPLGTAKTRIRDALRNLRTHLEDHR